MSERPDQLNTHVADQIDAYALGILEDEAVAEVEAHLAGCQDCQRLLRQARAVTALLALAPRQVAPPARLKQRILARIAQEEQDEQRQLQHILRLLRAPHSAIWELPGTAEAPQARARLLGAPEEPMAVLIVSGLQPLPPERDYQLWFLREGQPVGSAVFDVQQSGEGQILVHAPGQLGRYDLAAITPEPAGGSPGPTGPIVIAGAIKAA
ncbi:MAG TPA: anti-sigma factor [Ktedonobacterales bacterium]|jgi:anti-sigma-K factor RskA